MSLEGKADEAPVLVETRDLCVDFSVQRPGGGKVKLRAVDNLDLSIRAGQTFALVGESGSGKTTAGRAILQLVRPTAGTVTFDGRMLTELHGRRLLAARRGMQIVFQNPFSSLDPRMSIGRIISEPLEVARIGDRGTRRRRVAELLAEVGLPERAIDEQATNFSGGQRQRIAIARALAARPNFIVCDEPLSAIDVSLQAQILELLRRVRTEYKITLLFISHDLGVVRFLADRVAVMYLGAIVEQGASVDVFANPRHPYTRALIAAVPVPDPEFERSRGIQVLQGEIPDPTEPRVGCPFASRCSFARSPCRTERPAMELTVGDHAVACHYWQELPPPTQTVGKR